MLTIDIPDGRTIRLTHAVFDYNGTIALDGRLPDDIKARLIRLKDCLDLHVLTADTYGTVVQVMEPLGIRVATFPQGGASAAKAAAVRALTGGVVCFGNGFNDLAMFAEADLAVAILGGEGLFPGLLNLADVLVASAADGLDLLLCPDRLKATLRG